MEMHEQERLIQAGRLYRRRHGGVNIQKGSKGTFPVGRGDRGHREDVGRDRA